MSPLLIAHIAAGSIAILSGTAAVTVRKGERLHRAFGTVFTLAMLSVAAMAIYLALFVPPTAPGGAPPSASAAVGTLTLYLVATGWMTARRKDGESGLFEKGALLVILGVVAALAIFGSLAASGPGAKPGAYVPYFVFAGFAAFAALLDVKAIRQGGLSGAARIARHLWRMCFAFFFACAFFFIGQQKAMPAWLHRSPVLIALGLAPLVLLAFWMIRVRLTGWFKDRGSAQA